MARENQTKSKDRQKVSGREEQAIPPHQIGIRQACENPLSIREAAADRALLLADAEWLENRHHAGGMRPAVHN